MANSFTYQDKSYSTGDTVKLHLAVVEGDKTRIQIFQGLIIGISGSGMGKSVLVRKIATGAVGVERIVPLHSPTLIKIEKKTSGKVRRAKLYYLRDRIGRQASKVKTKAKTASAQQKIIKKDSKPPAQTQTSLTKTKSSKPLATPKADKSKSKSK